MQSSLKAFICSTYRDLSEERDAVVRALGKLKLSRGAMEFFGARPNRPIETCLDEVRRSDILIVIVGHLYGSLVPERKMSFTEAEYKEAKRQGKPCLVYFRDPDVPVRPEFFEREGEKIKLLEKFKDELSKSHTTDTFRSPADLAKKVTAALQASIAEVSANLKGRGEYLAVLKQGASAWNKWRAATHATARSGARPPVPTKLDLSGIDLRRARLRGIDLSGTIMAQADLSEADLRAANLRGTDLAGARLVGTNMENALLENANLSEANLTRATLSAADLTAANLTLARLIDTDLRNARLRDCPVFGASVWSLRTDGAQQTGLVISAAHEPMLTIDDIEVAQLHYLLMHSDRTRSLIDSLQTKNVLLLGRFSGERAAVLDTIKEELHRLGFMPVVFDFERPTARDFTESIMTLAAMSRFIVVDITNPKTTPVELAAVLPHYRTPVVPIIQRGERPFAMFEDLQKYPWVLPVLHYESSEALRRVFADAIVAPALRAKERQNGQTSLFQGEA
jgi:uncharacterized protein YjbI with pentapeptide repeats